MADDRMKPAGQMRTTLIGLCMIAMAMPLTYIVFCLDWKGRGWVH